MCGRFSLQSTDSPAARPRTGTPQPLKNNFEVVSLGTRRHQTFEGGGGQGLGIFTSVTVGTARSAASRPFEAYTGIHVNNVVSESVEKFGNPAVGLWVGVESF